MRTYFSYMKTTLILSAGLFVLALASAGCDEKKTDARPAPAAATTTAPGAIKSSCNNIKTLSTCTEYDDKAFALGESFVKGACEATSGKYASATCPAEKLLGTCAGEPVAPRGLRHRLRRVRREHALVDRP